MALLSSTDGVLLLILGLVALASAVLALRHRLAFRIALRNVRRGGSRSVILVLGLLVATTIISGSLVVGDTDNQLNLHYTYLALGHTDESIFNQTPTGDFTPFPYSVYNSVVGGVQSDRSVSGVTPMVLGSVQAFDRTSGVPQTNLHLVGVNGNQSANLGPFATDAGTSLSGPLPGQVLLDDQAASELNAAAGHTVDLYAIGTAPLTVQAIVQDNDRGAFLTAGLGSSGNVFVDLATAQSLLNVSGELNFLSVSNVGSVAGSVSSSDAVSAHLNATLAGDPAAKGLVVHESLKDGVSQAQQAGTSIETIFLVLGLFSIVAGAMLIVGIFVMLAEERKGEMGMLRAIGLTRRELVYIYYFEGLVYAAGSALAGTVLGVGVGFLMVYAFAFLLPSTGLTTSAILASFSVNPDSILISYVLGFLLTIVTVALASRRVSRLNIVRAIRDLPEPPTGLRTYTTFAYLGAAIAVLGGLLFAATFRGTSDVSYPLLGGSMLVGGIALVASRFVKNRWAFSFAGAGLLLWGGLEPLHSAVLGSNHTGGIFVVFVEGILLVFGALLLYVFNASALVQALLALAGGRRRGAPVARIALSYPGRQPTRTTINLAIFSLVVFTLVTISTFSSTVTANLESTIQDQSGGYSFFGFSQRPIPNLPGQIEGNASLSGSFSEVVPLEAGGVDLVVPGYAMNPFGDVLYAGPTGGPSSSDLYRTNAFPFSQTLGGISASAAWSRLSTDPSAAVVDHSYAPPTTNVASSGGPMAPHPTASVGESLALTNPLNGHQANVTVIGILSESFVNGIFVNPSTAQGLGLTKLDAFFLSVAPGVSHVRASQLAKAAFFPYGLVLFDFEALLATSISQEQGIIGLLEIFVGLGLAVGIAAMGILALRAVVERRREIGMLRAMGFTQRMTLLSFWGEYSFVSLLGIGIGTSLGLLIVYDLSQSPSAAAAGVATFAIPWPSLALIVGISYLLAMAAVAAPSRRASKLPPADAVRATE